MQPSLDERLFGGLEIFENSDYDTGWGQGQGTIGVDQAQGEDFRSLRRTLQDN